MSKPLDPPMLPGMPQLVPASPEVAALQARLLNLQIADLEKKQAEDNENVRISVEARKQGAQNMQNKRNQELQIQEACPHRKPNNQTAVTGQRDHQGHLALICQYCAAEWNEKTIPPFLIPPSAHIGGPQLGAI